MPYKDPEKRREYNREYQRLWARENREKRRVYESAWNEDNREKRREIQQRTRVQDRRKYRAQNTVHRALKDGRLVKGACEVCGTLDDIQGHHEDYDRPLDVNWLCRKHHMELHRRTP